jgi:hypothetical protein
MHNRLLNGLRQRITKYSLMRHQTDTEASLSHAARGGEALERALNTGDPLSLDEAIGLLEPAGIALAHDHPDRPVVLSNLGLAFRASDPRGGPDLVTQRRTPCQPLQRGLARRPGP